jgi:hypothetical protein
MLRRHCLIFCLLWTLVICISKVSSFQTMAKQNFGLKPVLYEAKQIKIEINTTTTLSLAPVLAPVSPKPVSMICASVATGIIASYSVIGCKSIIFAVGKHVVSHNPVASPVFASFIISLLHSVDSKLSSSLVNKQLSSVSVERVLLRIAILILSVSCGFCLGTVFYLVLVLYLFASFTTIGFAGPATEIGMVITLLLTSRLFPFSMSEKNDLVLSGSAAGFSTHYNTLAAGPLFTTEVISKNTGIVQGL